jgi:hypothetical protein
MAPQSAKKKLDSFSWSNCLTSNEKAKGNGPLAFFITNYLEISSAYPRPQLKP